MTDLAKPSVAFMIVSLERGGAQKQVRELTLRFGDVGWRVAAVISLLPLDDDGKKLRDLGIPVFSLEMRSKLGSPSALIKAVRLLRKLEPEMLVTFLYHASVLGSLAGWIARTPAVVASLRSQRLGGPVREEVFRLLSGLRHGTVVNSKAVAEDLVRRGVISRATSRVIKNGIQVEPSAIGTSPISRSTFDVPEDSFLWLAVGSLLPAKDYPTLLRAFARISGRATASRLLIAGTGPLEDELRQLSGQLGLTDRVMFLGLRDDVPDLLEMADAFVSSSAWEGLPNAVMEAMAAGKPVVATAVGGVPELVDSNRTGFLVPARQPDQLAGAMVHLTKLPLDERRCLGEEARATMIERHGWERILQEWDTALRHWLAEAEEGPSASVLDGHAHLRHD